MLRTVSSANLHHHRIQSHCGILLSTAKRWTSRRTGEIGLTSASTSSTTTSVLSSPSSMQPPPPGPSSAPRTAAVGQVSAHEPAGIIKDFDRGSYCELCAEPFGQWNEHRGKRDHLCLELFYNVIIEQARAWNASGMLIDHDKKFSKSIPLRKLFSFYDADQNERRRRLFAITKHLVDQGVLYLGPAQWRDSKLNEIQMGHNGALVLFGLQHPQIIHLFPKADAAQIASFSQACYNQYTLETVFDFLGYGHLLDAREMHLEGKVLGGGGGQKDNSSNNTSSASSSDFEVNWFTKALILRNILGQLRFALDDGHAINHPIGQTVHGDIANFAHIEVLCEELAIGIVTEVLFVRTSEFVTRADRVWRLHGCPTAVPASLATGTSRDVAKNGLGPNYSKPPNSSSSSSSVGGRGRSSFSQQNYNPYHGEGTPQSKTEHAIQMLNACFHSGLATVLGPSRGDVASRSGGEMFSDTLKSLNHPLPNARAGAKSAVEAAAVAASARSSAGGVTKTTSSVVSSPASSSSSVVPGGVLSLVKKRPGGGGGGAAVSPTAARMLDEAANGH